MALRPCPDVTPNPPFTTLTLPLTSPHRTLSLINADCSTAVRGDITSCNPDVVAKMAMQMEPPRDGPLPYAAATTLPASAQALHSPNNRITLPDLKTVLSNDFEPLPSLSRVMQEHDHHSASPVAHGPFPRIDQNHMHMAERTVSLESGMASPVTTASVISVEDRNGRPLSVVSVEDENVLIAAQALSGLGNPGTSNVDKFHHRPILTTPDYARRGPSRPPAYPVQGALPNGEPEPLLELIAQAHPWVGTTIKGSISAYSTTKNFSPRIVQYGANLVEKNIAFPVASAVGSVGEMTGVEYTVRRYLDARRPADAEAGAMDVSNDSAMDVDARPGLRRLSIDSLTEPLPVYGATRPPSYREEQSPASVERFGQVRPRNGPLRSWSSQFLVTTSGLSVALSSTSRQSLRFCLTLLGSSALRVSELTRALKNILEQYEQRRRDWHHRNSDPNLEKGERPQTPDQDDSARQLADQIKAQSEHIMATLQHVVNSVSNYAGGALPDNARQFVRSQLMSLPQRWRVVSGTSEASTDSETSKSAQRMIGFAKEGLDMITQVSNVVKATLDSAEKWLERVGRQDPQDPSDQTMQDAEPTYPPQAYHQDHEKL